MINFILTILVSAAVTAISALGLYNYLPLSALEVLHSRQVKLGSTITNIAGTDTLSSSRTTINNNFTNLNNGKIEYSSTSIAAVTTLANLVTVGTITSGTWTGSVIDVARQGTGTTSPSPYQVVLGNGALGLTIASSTGTSGQFLTSNGAGAYPSWQTSAVDQGLGYNWTGNHIFASSSHVLLAVRDFTATGTIKLAGIPYTFPSVQTASSSVLMTNNSGVLTWNSAEWQELAATSTTYATTSIPLTIAARRFIKVEISIPSKNSAVVSVLNFNSEMDGANYGWKAFEDGALSPENIKSYIALSGQNATTSAESWSVSVSNPSDARKLVSWEGTANNSGANMPKIYSGAGVWNVTSSAITNISIHSNNDSGTFGIGTVIKIYGSRD